MQTVRLIGEIFYLVASLGYFANQWLQARHEQNRWPFRKVTESPIVHHHRGACGMKNCRNTRSHSHVIDLCKRIKGK